MSVLKGESIEEACSHQLRLRLLDKTVVDFNLVLDKTVVDFNLVHIQFDLTGEMYNLFRLGSHFITPVDSVVLLQTSNSACQWRLVVSRRSTQWTL